MRRKRVYKAQHFIGNGADLPLGTVAAAQVEKVVQAAAVHGHYHFCLAGVGQYKAGVLVCHFAGFGAGGLFRHALLHQGVGMLFFQCFDQLQVVFGIGVHCINKSRFGRRVSLNFRGNHITEIFQPHIALALHTETCNAVAGDLCQKGAGNALDAKGKAGMFNGAGVAEVIQLLQKGCGLFRC